jgi:hypothetical protein
VFKIIPKTAPNAYKYGGIHEDADYCGCIHLSNYMYQTIRRRTHHIQLYVRFFIGLEMKYSGRRHIRPKNGNQNKQSYNYINKKLKTNVNISIGYHVGDNKLVCRRLNRYQTNT